MPEKCFKKQNSGAIAVLTISELEEISINEFKFIENAQ